MHSKMNTSIGFKINEVALQININFNKVLEPYGIAVEQRGTLEIIKNDPRVNQSVIANILKKDKTTISRGLNSLEKKGLIYKEESSTDKRAKMIKLTQKGEAILEESLETAKTFRETISSNLSQEELHTLFSLLDKISATL
ncbi:MAG: MarR family winged helix-turn-helix transcriptional regulator [Candidatus Marinarcus sp.]|uniref:MarR family winged helix-turn-helix transcriptional regulator n=1 Tax=Candidatus Marinarcus sp. TaxID=3100987 RepID=UPI003B00AA09